jgi:hypothetical protein
MNQDTFDFATNLSYVFIAVSCVTYSSIFLYSLCAWKSFNKYCNETAEELTGKSFEEEENTETAETTETTETTVKALEPPKHIRADHHFVKRALEDLKDNKFGFEKYKNGPFIELDNLVLKGGVLKYGNNQSVQKLIEQMKGKTRPRWIDHLCFIDQGIPFLLKDYLYDSYNVTFKGAEPPLTPTREVN